MCGKVRVVVQSPLRKGLEQSTGRRVAGKGRVPADVAEAEEVG